MSSGLNMHSVVKLESDRKPLAKDRFRTSERKPLARKDFVSKGSDALIKSLSFYITQRSLKNDVARAQVMRESEQFDKDLGDIAIEYALSTGESLPGLADGMEAPSIKQVAHLSTLILETPKANLRTMRALADNLGFVLMPFEYLDPAAYRDEPAVTKNAIRAFDSSLASRFSVYALAPVGYYSFERHVASSSDLPLRAPKGHEQTFAALDMVIPTIRTLQSGISSLKAGVEQMEGQLSQMKSALQRLEDRIERERTERVAQEMRSKAVEQERRHRIDEQLEREYERARRVLDPMLFALPKGESIEDDGIALIGPCWGPDLDNIIIAGLKLQQYSGQRKAIEKTLAKLLAP